MLITVMIAPAVLISAAGLLILGAVNRYGRIIDRLRHFNTLLDGAAEDQIEELREDRALLLVRARRSLLALTLLHGAVLCFVVESLLLGLVTVTSLPLAMVGDGVLVLGILFFGAASLFLLSEAGIALASTHREIERVDKKILRVRGVS